jgi:hypothetical protein
VAAGSTGAGVQFKAYTDLGMGPLLAHELVVANFQVPAELLEVPQVRTSRRSTMWGCLYSANLLLQTQLDHVISDENMYTRICSPPVNHIQCTGASV